MGINIRTTQGCGVFMIALAFPPARKGVWRLREAGHEGDCLVVSPIHSRVKPQ